MRQKLVSKEISTSFVGSNDQLADLLKKTLRDPQLDYICTMSSTYDIYALAWGGVLEGYNFVILYSVVSLSCTKWVSLFCSIVYTPNSE